ncbi:hypothetical protein CDAR_403511 [Caerostris darwini]|uniref:Kinesin motor domain-containing protein n=1 Tax=Caerostris darwini TaxID=1538125 RepID=A0AAV4N5A1_9ARAC|nr:hypothetical protein CDAR_403511 [Caerostris darwini]
MRAKQDYFGENVSVIAYGAGNTWKSHTIGTSPTRYVGSESEDLGLIQRTIVDLFQKRRGIPFSMHVSFLEVLGSTIKKVASEREFFSILERSLKNRKGRQSHLILNVILEITKGPLFNHRRVNFQFVDLSPRISPTDTCQNHALSLDFLSLRRVIQSFIWRKMYIPYRESMLTRLLKVKAVNSDLREKKDKEKSYEKMKTYQPLRASTEANILIILSSIV